MRAPVFPYTIVVFAPFLADENKPWSWEPVVFDPWEPEKAFEELQPKVYIPVPTDLCPAGGIELRFSQKRDFTPDALFSRQPFLSHLQEAADLVYQAKKKQEGQEEIAKQLSQWPDLPPIHLPRKKRGASSAKTQAKELESLLSMVQLPDSSADSAGKEETIEAIQKKILHCIFTHPTFKQMEAAWQGLHGLGSASLLADSGVQLLLVPTGRGSFEETLESVLPHLVQAPPSLILVDIPFDTSHQAIGQLTQLAEMAMTLLCPALAWITPGFFSIDTWEGISGLSYLPNHLDKQFFAKFKSFRKSPAGRWVGLVCNRLLGRYPYGRDNTQRLVAFQETGRPWIAPIWAVGRLIIQQISRSGWPTRFAEAANNYLEDPALDMTRDPPMPVEYPFSKERLQQMEQCGIMALASHKRNGQVFLAHSRMVSIDIDLGYQSLISLVSRFALWCMDTFGDEIQGESGVDTLQTTWKAFLDHRHAAHDDMPLEVEIITRDKQRIVLLRWHPGTKILPGGQELYLELPC